MDESKPVQKTADEIAQLTRTIIASVRLLDEAEKDHLERIAIQKREHELRRETISREIAEAAEALYLHAESARRGKASTLLVSADTTAKWYMSPITVAPGPKEERVLMPQILRALRRAGIVKRFTRKKIVYSLNRDAIKKHARLLLERGIDILRVEPAKPLFSLAIDSLSERIVRSKDTGQWRVIKARESIPDDDRH